MATHRADRQRPALDQFCGAVEAHGTGIALALLWVVPVAAVLVLLLQR